MSILAWFLLIFGLLLTLPAFIFPPIAVPGLGMMYGGYLLRRKAREAAMRRQQGRSSIDW